MKLILILSTAVILLCSSMITKVLGVVRLITLAHWSYVVGYSIYTEDVHGRIVFSVILFSFIFIGSLLPTFISPKLKVVATALSIPPQLHMLYLLNEISSVGDNLIKPVRIYTAVTLISSIWTIISIVCP